MRNINHKDIKVVNVSGKEMYALGNIDLLNQTLVSVAGARNITDTSKIWLRSALRKLPKNQVVVSGLALGSDTVAHETALKIGLKTIAVLPSGFERITPRTNLKLAKQILEDGGLLLSEYPTTKMVENHQYIERNQIIANMCKYLIVPQCEKCSGTMHTIRFLDKGKVIVTQDANYSGNQHIINSSKYITTIFKI